MKQFRSGHSVGFCQVAQAGSVLINNIGQSIQDYVNGLAAKLEAGRKETKGLVFTFLMQNHARVNAAGPLDRKHQRFPQAGCRDNSPETSSLGEIMNLHFWTQTPSTLGFLFHSYSLEIKWENGWAAWGRQMHPNLSAAVIELHLLTILLQGLPYIFFTIDPCLLMSME